MEDTTTVDTYISCQEKAEEFGWELTCSRNNFTLFHSPTNYKASYQNLNEVLAALDMVEHYES